MDILGVIIWHILLVVVYGQFIVGLLLFGLLIFSMLAHPPQALPK